MKDALFTSSYGTQHALTRVIEEITAFIAADPRRAYRITIGSDSERLASGHADFVTAIVVHRVGNGGRYFWRRVEYGPYHTLRDRIIQEVMLSLEAAQCVLEMLKERLAGTTTQWSFEVHADIGEHGATKAMLQEVVGMIRAYNFEPRTKPASYAASNIADRHV